MSKNILLDMVNIFKDTDEHNKLTRKDLEHKLRCAGFEKVDRHTISRNIEILNASGFDIAIERGRENKYYLRERLFEEWEIKLICDMVCECYFLSEKDSTNLVRKIENFTGIRNRKILNEADLYKKKREKVNINTKYAIHEVICAILEDKKVQFQYCEYDDKLNLNAKEKIYVVSPYKLVLKNGHYYLLLNKDGHNDVVLYRIDRIVNVHILEDNRRDIVDIMGQAYEEEINNIIKRRLYSYDGENIRLVIKVKKSVLGEIVDNFLDENIVLCAEEEYLTIAVRTCKSEGLYYWLMQHLETVVVIEPEGVRNELIEKIERVMKGYRK